MWKVKNILKIIFNEIDKHLPWPFLYPFRMTKKERKLFDKTVKKSKMYLEFGMGGSTFRALQNSRATVYSIDSSYDWIKFMRQYLFIRNMEKKRLSLIHIDIGSTQEWGYPIGDNSKEQFPNYSASIFALIEKKTLDTVFIDGRFRVACILKTILDCYSIDNLVIMIHDFWDREYYHTVLKYLDEVDSAETLGVFLIKKGLDINTIKKDYETYKYNPL